VSGDAGGGSHTLLRYAPARGELYLGALRVDALDRRGRPLVPEIPRPGPAPSLRCERDCLDVELDVADGPGPLRLPVPPGYGVVADSVRLGTLALPVQTDALGQPLVALSARTTARLQYRTASLDAGSWQPPAVPPDLPELLAHRAAVLRRLPLEARGPAALTWVREHVRYSLSEQVAARHRSLARVDFLERSLTIGAGDCDVQSGVLLPLLQAAGLPARLAVGYVGRAGQASARLHAWVEYRTPLSDWTIADASAGQPAETPPPSPPWVPALAVPRAAAPTVAGLPGLLAAVGLAGLAAALALLLLRRRPRLRLPAQPDLAGLLRGALQRPDAFRDAPAVFHRRLLRLAAGGSASLAEAWERAHEGRLFSTRRRPPLARAAASGGAAVLDERRPEGRAVGELLGALPLDEWDRRLRDGRSSPLLAAVERSLAASGEPWSLRAGGTPALEAIELPGPGGVARYAVIPGAAAPLEEAEALWPERPQLAALRLAEWLADVLGFGCRDVLLSRLARAAVREAAG
jgi:transglutaminase-like putative cysteine protease